MEPANPKVLVQYMRDVHNVLIGERTAESCIRELASTPPVLEDGVEYFGLRGRNLFTGQPTGIELTRFELRDVLSLPQASDPGKRLSRISRILQVTLPIIADAKLVILVYRSS